ncbi:MAG: exonuclease SbcCD subunit D [Coprococcus sp.]
MRFFHLSDLHIGRQLYQYSLLEDQRAILGQIVERAREYRPDAILIAGDIFDKPVPSGEAVTVFDHFLTELAHLEAGPELMITAGNHDSAERLDYGAALLDQLRIHIAALPPEPGEYLKRIRLNDAFGPVDFYLMPFIKPPYIRRLFEQEGEPKTYDGAVRALLEREQPEEGIRKVIVSHQFFTAAGAATMTCDSEILQVGGLDQVDISALRDFDYGALGHIHGPQSIGSKRFRYCGSPLKYSLSEAGHHKSLTLVELGEIGTEPVITELPLIPVRDVRSLRGELDELVSAALNDRHRDDYVSITLTDEREQMDARERLLEIYPNLLEVQVDNTRTRQQLAESFDVGMVKEPEEIFAEFFEGVQGRSLTGEEKKIIQTVINRSKIQDAGQEGE